MGKKPGKPETRGVLVAKIPRAPGLCITISSPMEYITKTKTLLNPSPEEIVARVQRWER